MIFSNMSRARVLPLGLACIAMFGACTTKPSTTLRRPQATGKTILTTTRELPAGVWYVLAGPNDQSANLWRLSRSAGQTEMTHNNKKDDGIDAISATEAGIVVANAASGQDTLDHVTRRGLEKIPGGHGYVPIITKDGRVMFAVPDSPTYYIKSDITTESKSRTVYSQRQLIGTIQSGPKDEIVFDSNPHLPGPGGPQQVREVTGVHQYRVIPTGVSDPSNVSWSADAVGLAIDSYTKRGVVVMSRSHLRWSIPRGWQSVSWSPNGRELVVLRGRQIGVWPPGHAQQVHVVGSVPPGTTLIQASWLQTPARVP
jgi:hypothetical protein